MLSVHNYLARRIHSICFPTIIQLSNLCQQLLVQVTEKQAADSKLKCTIMANNNGKHPRGPSICNWANLSTNLSSTASKNNQCPSVSELGRLLANRVNLFEKFTSGKRDSLSYNRLFAKKNLTIVLVFSVHWENTNTYMRQWSSSSLFNQNDN